MNTNVVNEILKIVCPTLHYTQSSVAKTPIIYDSTKFEVVDLLVKEENIMISKTDWNSSETSWDFKRHPFIQGKNKIAESFMEWDAFTIKQFSQLKSNEEELNRIFIDIYGLRDELIPKVEDKDVTVRKAYLSRDIHSFISYAVGCMFGRYSLDINGLVYAGGKWDDSKYKTFIPDKDNILPITDEEYFEDDVVGLFCTFLKKTFGVDTLEENLDFIAKALGRKQGQ